MDEKPFSDVSCSLSEAEKQERFKSRCTFSSDMPLFQDMLKSGETLFKDTLALDFDYIPKLLQYREKEQRHVAACINPLLMNRNGRNLFVYGPPGVGKTAALKWVLRDLEEHSDQYDVEVASLYVNCWQKNTTFKIVVEICELLDYKFTQNKKTEELLNIIKERLNSKTAVFVFDEIDKVEDHHFLYTFLEEIFKKSIILITNYRGWFSQMDERIRSRLTPEMLEFREYNLEETRGILKQRRGFAFMPNVWDEAEFEKIVKKCYEVRDIRTGLFMMKEAGELAEEDSSRKILAKHADAAILKCEKFTVKSPELLEDETQQILRLIELNTGKKIGDLFRLYQSQNPKAVYKTFQRKIAKLAQGKFIDVEKISGGTEGTTTMVHAKRKEKTLGEF